MMESEFPSQRITGSNKPPKFADDQDLITPEIQNNAARTVAENTSAGKTVGSPVVATDENGDTLTYTLTDADGGTDGDSASFSIDWGTGQIMTKGALNHETDETYTVLVRATDPRGIPGAESAVITNSDTVTVEITVTDVNEAPAVMGVAAVDFNEDDGNIETALDTYTADDPDADSPESTWSVDGADGSKFTAVDGALKFKKKPDYEKPTDANKDNVYEVTVQASDGKKTGMIKVMVSVTNADEDGVVTLSKVQPVVGIPVKATLTDPDGSISKLTWQWSRNGTDITDANSDTYTPVDADVEDTLTATASYFDGERADGVKKTAFAAAVNAVERDTRNKPPVFGDEDDDTAGVQNATATRKVEENTAADASDDSAADQAGDNVGAQVVATDTKAAGGVETLTYSLGGADGAMFRVRNNGQIEVAAGTMLDYETKNTYRVTVMAEDPLGASASIMVTITVTDLDEMPDVSGDAKVDYPEKGKGPVETYRAKDPEGASVQWSLGGVDAGDFTIENGVLRFKASPDFENPKGGTADPPTSNTYTVEVQATDETRKVGTYDVTVEVTNVNEGGTVTLSARRPQTDIAFTAAVTDPDDGVVDEKWQWSKASSKNGFYRDIAMATAATYPPKDADAGSYLRATVTYEDAEGEGKSAMMESEFPSQRITGDNKPPKFADDQDLVTPEIQNNAARTVAENTSAGKTVGSPVVATDENGDTLTYTLTDADGGTDGDSASFSIDWGTGQIMTKGALNHETDETYTVLVRATDPRGIPGAESAVITNSDTVTVEITVTDVNEAPAVMGVAAVDFNEDDGNIETALDTYTADDPDADSPESTWSVDGADGSKFTAVDGALKFKKKPDYEKPTDANKDNVYEVTVQASDGKKTGMIKVMVSVTNADEDGVVTLSKVQPVVGIPVKATLTDPDGSISKLTWQWSRNGTDITDANSDTYTPVDADVEDTLTATASYFDGERADGVKKTAFAAAVNAVERDTRNKPPVFGDEDDDTAGVQNATATRKVEENTAADASDDSAADQAGDNVGAQVVATDTKAAGGVETLTYSLGGADGAMFRVRNNGQIEVAAGTMLDYETKNTYRVTVMAEDPLGASASIKVTIMVTDLDEMPDIMRAPDSNVAPEFASATTSRTVAENTAAGENIGNPVAASDANGDALTYALSGTDTASFAIDSDTGQLMTLAALDYETKATYSVTVTASDSGGLSDPIDVTITVTDDVDEAPVITGDAAPNYAENGTGPVATYSATDPESETITWSLEGDDASLFDLSQVGVLTFNDPPDYEMPGDADEDNAYEVTVVASDGTNEDRLDVTVTVTVTNVAPEFADSEDGARSVAENTAAGENIGNPVAASDANGDALTYALSGTDTASFAIDSDTGQLMTLAALDYETKTSYSVTVAASDSGGLSDSIDVTITVTDVDEAPVITGDAALNYAENGTGPVATYSATDPESETITWSLEGDDASLFDLSQVGVLTFNDPPDYEMPGDADEDNAYEVTVVASDGTNEDRLDVTVTVTDTEEVIWGDVDNDGDVDAVDALQILRYAVDLPVSTDPSIGSTVTLVDGSESQAAIWGDVDNDGDVDAVDALQILRYAAGLSVSTDTDPAIGEIVTIL